MDSFRLLATSGTNQLSTSGPTNVGDAEFSSYFTAAELSTGAEVTCTHATQDHSIAGLTRGPCAETFPQATLDANTLAHGANTLQTCEVECFCTTVASSLFEKAGLTTEFATSFGTEGLTCFANQFGVFAAIAQNPNVLTAGSRLFQAEDRTRLLTWTLTCAFHDGFRTLCHTGITVGFAVGTANRAVLFGADASRSGGRSSKEQKEQSSKQQSNLFHLSSPVNGI